MNGEFQELFEEIKKWSGKVHEQRHLENLDKFSEIFKTLKNLPCKERVASTRFIMISMGGLWITVGIIIRELLSR